MRPFSYFIMGNQSAMNLIIARANYFVNGVFIILARCVDTRVFYIRVGQLFSNNGWTI